MERRRLGRTDLQASIMGLGAGGPSRLGRGRDKDEAASIAIVRAALDAGVNFIDTAESYRTEAIVGKALREAKRDDVILSTKKSTWGETRPTAADVVASLEASLSRLGVEAVDIYHMHGVAPTATATSATNWCRLWKDSATRARSASWASPRSSAATTITPCWMRPSTTTAGT